MSRGPFYPAPFCDTVCFTRLQFLGCFAARAVPSLRASLQPYELASQSLCLRDAHIRSGMVSAVAMFEHVHIRGHSTLSKGSMC